MTPPPDREPASTPDKFIGVAVMALWRVPESDPQHAAHAVQAAMATIAGVNLAARIEGATRSYDVPLLMADTTRAAAGELAGCDWVKVDEVAVKGRSQLVTLYVPLPVTDVSLPGSGPRSEQEIAAFHEQLGLWRLACDALRGHHGNGTREALTPSARTVAHARLTELLAARPASPQLHALAARRLASLAAEQAQEQEPSR